MNWERADAALRQMWADGLTGAIMAERLGTTKNAVIGRVHRLGLPARPSPIRAPHVSPNARKPKRRQHPATVLRGAVAPAAQATSHAAPAARIGAAAVALPVGAARSCQWPLWADGVRPPQPPLFCGAAVAGAGAATRSYCAAHAALAVTGGAWGHARPAVIADLISSNERTNHVEA